MGMLVEIFSPWKYSSDGYVDGEIFLELVTDGYADGEIFSLAQLT